MPDDPPATQASIDNEFDANCESRFTRRQKDDRARDLGRFAEALAQEWTVEKGLGEISHPFPKSRFFGKFEAGRKGLFAQRICHWLGRITPKPWRWAAACFGRIGHSYNACGRTAEAADVKTVGPPGKR